MNKQNKLYYTKVKYITNYIIQRLKYIFKYEIVKMYKNY